VGSCVYRKNYCNLGLQPWARAVRTLPAVLRLTQPSNLRGTGKWVSAFELRNNCNEKKRSERRKHCAMAVVRRSQKISPCRRPPSRGRRTTKI